uniref:LOW QUALITY PROTEIN: acyl transferase 8-like n=1 Tax=Arvicanthis niloticus TaxID=61156 RepID=UPI001487549D|nr:LOW QUALITY PROTEIN: acyl transferase 8-like [Arvicanthis niloticus]
MVQRADTSETQVEKPAHLKLEMPIQAPSKRKQPLDQKQEEKRPSESGGNNGRRSKSSPMDKENTCGTSREAKVPRQKLSGQSWAVSSCGLLKRSSRLEEKRRARPSPSRERRRDKPGSTQRRDSLHTKLHGKDPRPQPRSPVRRTLKRSHSGDSHDAPHQSAKRHRQPSPPEASSFSTFSPLMSRVFTNMGALQVALDDLKAPGGAFLSVPSSSKEPTVSQRAWLTWQLSHAGAALHWARHTVNSILTAQDNLCRYTWPQGDSCTAHPRPVPTSSSRKTQASRLVQRPGDSASPSPSQVPRSILA